MGGSVLAYRPASEASKYATCFMMRLRAAILHMVVVKRHVVCADFIYSDNIAKLHGKTISHLCNTSYIPPVRRLVVKQKEKARERGRVSGKAK